MQNNIVINEEILNVTFPFYFTVDDNLVIKEAGKSILKMIPGIRKKFLHEVFDIQRPYVPKMEFQHLKKLFNQIIILKLKTLEGEPSYKGQLLYLPDSNQIIFIGSIWLTSVEELKNYKLLITDYSLSDSTTDMLQLIKLNELVADDIKKLNDHLKASEEKYRELIEGASDIIFQTDDKGYFQYMNEVGFKILGVPKDFIIKQHFTRIIREDFKENVFNQCLSMYSKGIDSDYMEFPIRLSITEEEKWIGQNVRLIKSGNQVIGFRAVARDITERVLQQRELVAEKEKAQAAAKAKSRFVANMSHEIRTPLNGIVGLTNLLMGTDLSVKQKQYLQAIITSSDTLMVVVNDILDISKIEAGKLKISYKSFKLNDSLYQLLEMMNSKAIHKNIVLEGVLDQDVPHVLIGDSARINQILYNIIGNAIKFTEKGKVTLTTKLLKKEQESVLVEFKIKDTGIGISKEELPNIFKAFNQVEDETDRKFGGTGLGLTIAKRLIELQHGALNVESEIEVGTEFTIHLPFKISNELLNNTSKNTFVGTKDVKLQFLNILLAEDNPVNQLVTIDLLESQGAKVVLANNGKEALEKLEKESFNVILMDMQMPIMDGYLAMENIRNGIIQNTIPIIALTAHVTEGEIEKCKKFGADEYLSKPFNPNDLYLKITSLLSKNKQQNIQIVEEIKPDSDHFKMALIDLSMLKNFTNNKEKLMVMTLQSLITELPKDITKMNDLLQLQDWDQIRAISHRCKPNFMLVTNPEIQNLVITIEKNCKENNNLDVVKKNIDQLFELSPKLVEAIESELHNINS